MLTPRRVAALCAAAATAGLLYPLPAHADVKSPRAEQSANIQTTTSTDHVPLDSDATRQMFYDMAVAGQTSVTIDIPLYQSSLTATKITTRRTTPDSAGTPSDAELIRAIHRARRAGLNVILKPHLAVLGGEWRAHVTFDQAHNAQADEWQRSWSSWLVHYGRIAQAEHVTTMVVGTEQRGTTLNRFNKYNGSRWAWTVRDLDKVFYSVPGSPKTITYAAHMTSEARLLPKEFVWTLDTLGVTYYPKPANDATTATRLPQLTERLRLDRHDYFADLWAKFAKPVVALEAGAWSDWHGTVDLAWQADYYRALLASLDATPHVSGVALYRWYNTSADGGADDSRFTPQGKPAVGVEASYFGGQTPRTVDQWWPVEDARLSHRTAVKVRLTAGEASARFRVDGKGAWVTLRHVTGTSPHEQATLDPSSWTRGAHYVETQALDSHGRVVAATAREVLK